MAWRVTVACSSPSDEDSATGHAASVDFFRRSPILEVWPGGTMSLYTINSALTIRHADVATVGNAHVRSRRLRFGLLAVAALLLGNAASAQDGSADPGFVADTNGGTGYVNAVVRQSDGKILVGGSFTTINGVEKANIVRLNAADGSVDSSFVASVTDPINNNAQVSVIAVQPDGRILVGGTFTAVDGVQRNSLARLNIDGSVDTSFDPAGTGGPNGSVYALALQSDGRIYVGGSFNSVGATARASLARLNANGSLDASFTEANEFVFSVRALLLQPDGKLVTGWEFGAGEGNYIIVRLNTNGTLDTTFNVSLGDSSPTLYVSTLTWQPDDGAGKILIAGNFPTINGTPRNCVARVNAANGVVDSTYNPDLGAGCYVEALLRKPDGSVLVSGGFDTVGGQARSNFARLKPSGQLDAGFDATTSPPNSVANVSAIAQQPDGKLVVGGIFSVIGGESHYNIARILDDKIFANGFEAQ
jgi:uncharacterized delta-60 repeat protein